MAEYTLHVQPRSTVGHHNRHLRATGFVPAVIYGGKQATQNLQIEERELDRLLSHGGALHLISLVGDNFVETRALIRDVQRHPVRRNLLHVDFVRVARDQKIHISVPLHMVGHAPATELGAILLQNVDSVEIECLPDDMPTHIDVDVSGLAELHQHLTAHNLVLPKGVKLLGDPGDEPLISVTIPRAAAHAEEDQVEAAAAEPEIISERKKAEEA